jgi:hypothetical protein
MNPPTTPAIVQARYLRSLDPSLKRGAWTSEEDARLREAVKVWGKSWVDVAECIEGRNNEQCRDRWSNLTSGKKASVSREIKFESEIAEEEALPEDAGNEGPSADTSANDASKNTEARARPVKVRYWTEDEDAALWTAVEDLGARGCNWEEVSKRVSEVGDGRSSKQVGAFWTHINYRANN